MSKRKAQLIEVTEEHSGVVALADRRVTDILIWWALRGDHDLRYLLRSAYIQGVNDAIEANDRQMERDITPL